MADLPRDKPDPPPPGEPEQADPPSMPVESDGPAGPNGPDEPTGDELAEAIEPWQPPGPMEAERFDPVHGGYEFEDEPPIYEVPRKRRKRVAELGGLRVVIVAWCFWLLGAWAVSWLSDTSVPRVRWMLFAGTFGLMLVWPAFRLSEHVRPGDPMRGAMQVLLDWVALAGVYQAVIWSLNLIAAWPFERGLWVDLAILSWSLLSALVVAAVRLWPGALVRWLGMAVCIALVFGEPVAVWLSLVSGGESWPIRFSPIQTMWELTRTSGQRSLYPWDQRTIVVGLVAVSGWLSLIGWAVGEKLVARRRALAA